MKMWKQRLHFICVATFLLTAILTVPELPMAQAGNCEDCTAQQTVLMEAGTQKTQGIQQTKMPRIRILPQRYTTKLENMADTGEITAEGVSEGSYAVLLTTEEFWEKAYGSLEEVMKTMKKEEEELKLMSVPEGHMVRYGGNVFTVSEEEYQVLLRIVESEAPAEDIEGRMLVACVVLNRVLHEDFPNTIKEVVFQKKQFSPIESGYYWRVDISEKTKEAVERVLGGEDESQGAMFFMAREKANKNSVRWFDTKLKFLFKHGGHEFFTLK